jgi:hypothetical protein
MLVVQDGQRTRDLMQVNIIDELRARLACCASDHRLAQSQLAAQGTVNFGTMAGNAGRNTSTNNIV